MEHVIADNVQNLVTETVDEIGVVWIATNSELQPLNFLNFLKRCVLIHLQHILRHFDTHMFTAYQSNFSEATMKLVLLYLLM